MRGFQASYLALGAVLALAAGVATAQWGLAPLTQDLASAATAGPQTNTEETNTEETNTEETGAALNPASLSAGARTAP